MSFTAQTLGQFPSIFTYYKIIIDWQNGFLENNAAIYDLCYVNEFPHSQQLIHHGTNEPN